MKVALVGPGILPIPPNGYGAVEKHIWHLATQLRARGHDVTILNELDGEYAWGIKVGKLLQRSNFDVVHAHTSFLGGYLARFKLEAEERLVYTSHSPLWFIETAGRGPKERWGMLWEIAAIKFATAVIALTPEQAAKFDRYRALSEVVPNGVDCKQFQPDWEARTGTKVCMLGKVVERKRVHVVAEAMAEVKAEFHVIGPTPDREYFQFVHKLNPKTVFHSGLDEVELAGLLASMDVFVHASEAEAMSIAVLEAMACGLPVVHTASSAPVVGEEPGTLVRDGELATEYIGPIEKLLGDNMLRGFLGRKMRERAVQCFDWPKVAEEVEAVYASVAG